MHANFQTDRLCFDRSVWTVYFKSTVQHQEENHFDLALVDRLNLEDHLKSTNFKGRGKEKVFYRESGGLVPYAKYEFRLKSTRSMNVYFNFNRYFLHKLDIHHDIKCPVIHDDNFLPIDSQVKFEDYLKVFNETFPESLRQIYLSTYRQFWPVDYAIQKDEVPVVKCTTLELAREMYPLSVQDVRNDLAVKGRHFQSGTYEKTNRLPFKSYNDSSKTIYFGEKPDGATYKVDGSDLVADLDTWNWREDGAPKQGKLYQKSVNLGRFEVTLYANQIDFGISGKDDQVEGSKFILQNFAEDVGLSFVPMEYNYDEMMNYLAELFKLDMELMKLILREGTYWPSCKENHVLTQKLKRRGILKKSQRGSWIVNPAFLKMFEKYVRPKEEKFFLPSLL